MSRLSYKRVLSIAGSDSGGGAGIQADIKAISACGGYAATVITAVTIQNTVGVKGVHVIPAEVVEAQIEAVLEDIGADAVKLGMLPNAEIIEAVARQLIRFQVRNIVLDPVMISTSGHRLIDLSAVEAIRERLFPLATLITPNLPEAEYITGIKITSEEDFAKVAAAFQNQNYSCSILLKAGHLNASSLADYLYTGKEVYSYRYDRIDTPNTHGTGCTLSSSIATFLAAGHPLPDAVDWAEKYIHKAILCGKEYEIGHGHGPVDHFYRFRRAFEG